MRVDQANKIRHSIVALLRDLLFYEHMQEWLVFLRGGGWRMADSNRINYITIHSSNFTMALQGEGVVYGM